MAGRFVGFGKKLFDLAKGSGDKSKVATTIVGVTPKVNKTKLDVAKSNLAKAIQKGKATSAKLKQTQFEIKNPKFKGKDFTFAKTNKKTESNKEAYKRIQGENTKVLKGMIDDAFKDKKKKTKVFYPPKDFNKGGRVGLKGGTNLGMQSVKYGLDNNPKITAADPKAKFIAANKKKKKKFESPMAKAIKKKNKKRII